MSLWTKVVGEGKKKDNKGIANRLTEGDVVTIIATMDFFGATQAWMHQTFFDLTVPRYRVFDWLGMCIMGRNDDDSERNSTALKVLVHAFLTADLDPKKFIENLRLHDYQIETDWENVVLD